MCVAPDESKRTKQYLFFCIYVLVQCNKGFCCAFYEVYVSAKNNIYILKELVARLTFSTGVLCA